MHRRSVLKALAGGIGLATCPYCLGALAAEGQKPAHWTYQGAAGPQNWGSLSPSYGACSGKQQSPIDLTGPIDAGVKPLEFAYGPSPLEIVNNGHTVQVNYAAGSTLTVGGVRHMLLQFHFHHPSEHAVDGNKAPMEVHFVHRDNRDNLAVVGVLINSGPANRALQPIWDQMPMFEAPVKKIPDATINAANLLPPGRGSHQYYGSLTTPPCSEGVHWIVLKDPITASPEQIQKFATAFPINARPLQALNRRFLLRSQ